MKDLNLKMNWQCSGWAMRANHSCNAWAWAGQHWEIVTGKPSWHRTAYHFVCQCPVKTYLNTQTKGFLNNVLSSKHLNKTTLTYRYNYQDTNVISICSFIYLKSVVPIHGLTVYLSGSIYRLSDQRSNTINAKWEHQCIPWSIRYAFVWNSHICVTMLGQGRSWQATKKKMMTTFMPL